MIFYKNWDTINIWGDTFTFSILDAPSIKITNNKNWKVSIYNLNMDLHKEWKIYAFQENWELYLFWLKQTRKKQDWNYEILKYMILKLKYQEKSWTFVNSWLIYIENTPENEKAILEKNFIINEKKEFVINEPKTTTVSPSINTSQGGTSTWTQTVKDTSKWYVEILYLNPDGTYYLNNKNFIDVVIVFWILVFFMFTFISLTIKTFNLWRK